MRNIDMNTQMIAGLFSQAKIPYAILDEEEFIVRILIPEDSRELLKTLASKFGWRLLKDKTKDLYLYGMNHFIYYSVNRTTLVVCCQLACRSTLNNGWVPLDRKINAHALKNIRAEGNINYLSAEDELCYLTAKCIYTEKTFCASDIKRIEACMSIVDRKVLTPKLEGIFFKFTDSLLQLLDQKQYADIIASLWRFAAY